MSSDIFLSFIDIECSFGSSTNKQLTHFLYFLHVEAGRERICDDVQVQLWVVINLLSVNQTNHVLEDVVRLNRDFSASFLDSLVLFFVINIVISIFKNHPPTLARELCNIFWLLNHFEDKFN